MKRAKRGVFDISSTTDIMQERDEHLGRKGDPGTRRARDRRDVIDRRMPWQTREEPTWRSQYPRPRQRTAPSMYPAASTGAIFPKRRKVSVTAGFMWAPDLAAKRRIDQSSSREPHGDSHRHALKERCGDEVRQG